MREVVIVGAARTPIGSFQGELAPLKAPELGKAAIVEALRRAGASPDDVNEVFMGCVLPAGVGQAPARQASIFAGLPKEVPCTTINKVCGSGLQGGDARRAGDHGRRGRRGRRGRHGVDVERAVLPADGAHRHAHGQRRPSSTA